MNSRKKNCTPTTGGESERAAAARLTGELGFEVTRDMIRNWKKKGYILADTEALQKSLANQERAPKGFKPATVLGSGAGDNAPLDPDQTERDLAELQRMLIAAPDYETARKLRTQIAGVREVLKELREQGKYILREEATAAGMRAGLASRGAWEGIEDELPPQLEGLTAAQMKVKLRDYGRLKSLELAELFNA